MSFIAEVAPTDRETMVPKIRTPATRPDILEKVIGCVTNNIKFSATLFIITLWMLNSIINPNTSNPIGIPTLLTLIRSIAGIPQDFDTTTTATYTTQ